MARLEAVESILPYRLADGMCVWPDAGSLIYLSVFLLYIF